MNDCTTKLLGLKDVIIKNIWEDEVSRHIEIELPRKEHRCPCCGEHTNKVHEVYQGLPRIRQTSISPLPQAQRYVCSACGKRFYESNSFVPRYYRMTSRKCAQIINDFRETVSASHIAREQNMSVSTALRYFDLVHYSCKRLLTVLSIDEFKGNAGGEKFQFIIADAASHRPVDILPNGKKRELIRYFLGLKSRKDVEFVVIDMNSQSSLQRYLSMSVKETLIKSYHIQ